MNVDSRDGIAGGCGDSERGAAGSSARRLTRVPHSSAVPSKSKPVGRVKGGWSELVPGGDLHALKTNAFHGAHEWSPTRKL